MLGSGVGPGGAGRGTRCAGEDLPLDQRVELHMPHDWVVGQNFEGKTLTFCFQINPAVTLLIVLGHSLAKSHDDNQFAGKVLLRRRRLPSGRGGNCGSRSHCLHPRRDPERVQEEREPIEVPTPSDIHFQRQEKRANR